MTLAFPDNISNYRQFFEQLAENHIEINHHPIERNRFSEIMYLDFPAEDYDTTFWAAFLSSKESNLDPQGDEAGVCIMTQDIANFEKINKIAQASVIIFKKYTPAAKSNRQREILRNELIDSCSLIAEDFKDEIEKYFKNNPKGTIIENSFTTAPTKMPAAVGSTFYGTRLDFKYKINKNNHVKRDVWKEVME